MMQNDPYDNLKWAAYFPESLEKAVRCCVNQFAFDASVTQLVFPQSHSGYTECHVIDALRAAGRIPGVRHVVFQDVWYKHPDLDKQCNILEWQPTWLECVTRHGMTLTVCNTYTDLLDTCALTNRPSGVIYINGAFMYNCFNSHAFGGDYEAHRLAARRFWGWCATHARNAAVNILDGDVRQRGETVRWDEWL